MNRKIKNYIDLMFEDVPNTSKAKELKEEMISNANDRYEDYIRMGKSETEAYGLAVSSIGDVDDLLNELKPNAIQQSDIKYYRNRNAKAMAVAVMLYIISPIIVVGTSLFWGDDTNTGVLSVVLMLLLIAIATGIIVYTQLSTPQEIKHYNQSMESKEWSDETRLVSKRNRSLYHSIRSIFWSIITCIYLGISFLTGAWYITWLIWLIASAFDRMIILWFQLKEEKNNEY